MRKIKRLVRGATPFLIGIILIIFTLKLLRIKNIECVTQYGECSQNTQSDLQILLNRSMFSPLPDLSPTITQHDLSVKSVALNLHFPNTVEANVQLRTPLGQVSDMNNSSQYGLVDDSGIIYKVDNKLFFPLLIIDGWQPGIKSISPLHVQALYALNVVHDLLKTTVTGRIVSNGLLVSSANNPDILIDPKLSPSQWGSSLQVIIDRSKIQNKLPRKIDLRFNQPVLEYK